MAVGCCSGLCAPPPGRADNGLECRSRPSEPGQLLHWVSDCQRSVRNEPPGDQRHLLLLDSPDAQIAGCSFRRGSKQNCCACPRVEYARPSLNPGGRRDELRKLVRWNEVRPVKASQLG